jgi:hypothetical protein
MDWAKAAIAAMERHGGDRRLLGSIGVVKNNGNVAPD